MYDKNKVVSCLLGVALVFAIVFVRTFQLLDMVGLFFFNLR